MKFSGGTKVWLLLSCLVFSAPGIASELDSIIPGNWVEVRGKMDEQGIFQAQRIELIDPQGSSVLIGTISSASQDGSFKLLGQDVQLSKKTELRKVSANDLLSKRVKLEGRYQGPKRFSARQISIRGAGRETITGLVSEIERTDGGYLLTIMNKRIVVPDDVELRHEKPTSEFAIASLNVALPQAKPVSEDDQFGDGFRISNRVRFTTQIEARYLGEDNYNLDELRDQDLQDSIASINGRFILAPSNYGISGQLQFRYVHIRSNVDSLGTFDIDDTRLAESWVYLDDPFEVDFDIQLGRMDFDDRREWLYDQNLDGVRAYWRVAGWLAELSATTTLSEGKLKDENTNNFVAYVTDINRRFATYIIHRDSDFQFDEKITHMGIRAFGDWPPEHESWLEISHMRGSRDSTDLRGWAVDIGTTRNIGKRWFITTGWAFAQGDANTQDGKDGNFRQTQLQDNNGKFGGVTSFRYYGELIDPELANIHIGTLGLGYLFTRTGSIDLVGHYYRQDKAFRKILDSDIDQRLNGIDREIGWEVDAIVGWRPVRAWDFEFVLAWFKPGKAFRRKDDAWMTKLQVRYRY